MHLRSVKKRYFGLLFILTLTSTAFAQETLHEGWARFALSGAATGPLYGASSVLEGAENVQFSRYSVDKAFDQNTDTAWVEGVSGPGKGEALYIGLEQLPEALGIINGYAQNRDLWQKNHRVKRLKAQVWAAVNLSGFAGQWQVFYDAQSISEEISLHLQDTITAQHVALPFSKKEVLLKMKEIQKQIESKRISIPQAIEMGISNTQDIPKHYIFIIKLEIQETYAGSKWEDTCIAEIWPDYGTLSKVQVSTEGQSLIGTDTDGQVIQIFHLPEHTVTLLDISADAQWAILLKEISGPVRVQTTYSILHLASGRDMSKALLGPQASRLLAWGFSSNDSHTLVHYEDLSNGQEGEAICTLYK